MKIIVDADACPVKDIIAQIADKYGLPLLLITDTAHHITTSYALGQVITVDKQSDSADFAIVNRTDSGDVVVTQDYGLATMVLAKKACAVNNFGKAYTADNIDRLLFERHLNKKARSAGLKTTNMKKRQKADNDNFRDSFETLIKECLGIL